MILVDTSIWVDHFRQPDPILMSLLEAGEVLAHPFVTGEVALGQVPQRDTILHVLHRLPQAEVAKHRELLRFITDEALFGIGIGYVDTHLLASVRLTRESTLWTRDKRLHSAAQRLSVAAHIVS